MRCLLLFREPPPNCAMAPPGTMGAAPATERVLIVYREAADVEPYARAIEAVGAEPLLREARPGIEIGSCGGLLLTGGRRGAFATVRRDLQRRNHLIRIATPQKAP